MCGRVNIVGISPPPDRAMNGVSIDNKARTAIWTNATHVATFLYFIFLRCLARCASAPRRRPRMLLTSLVHYHLTFLIRKYTALLSRPARAASSAKVAFEPQIRSLHCLCVCITLTSSSFPIRQPIHVLLWRFSTECCSAQNPALARVNVAL
jgi:hypothetical protein